MSKQPEALRLADAIAEACLMDGISRRQHLDERLLAAAELRRLHSLNAELVDALEKLHSCWVSVCIAQGWSPDHVSEATNARAAISKAKEAQQ